MCVEKKYMCVFMCAHACMLLSGPLDTKHIGDIIYLLLYLIFVLASNHPAYFNLTFTYSYSKFARRHLVIPSVFQNDYEKSLKKVATRGVIALFNAIAQSKRDDIEEGDAESSKYGRNDVGEGNDRAGQISDIKEMTQSKFIDLLTKNSNESDSGRVSSIARKKTGSTASKSNERQKERGKPLETTWGVLNDEYMLNKSNSLRKWDNALYSSGDDDDDDEGMIDN